MYHCLHFKVYNPPLGRLGYISIYATILSAYYAQKSETDANESAQVCFLLHNVIYYELIADFCRHGMYHRVLNTLVDIALNTSVEVQMKVNMEVKLSLGHIQN